MNEYMVDLPPIEDRPLVTFALFAYNQEKYIREAIEGAFAQTYEPLEIIISDDCSTDKTFDIIESMVVDYDGPHRVISNRMSLNNGILAHVMHVARQAQGDFVVMAAGDDVSMPYRTESLVRAWRETGAWGMYSLYDVINDSGSLLQINSKMKGGDWLATLSSYFESEGGVTLVHGATSAYDKRIYGFLAGVDLGGIHTEDGVISFLLNLLNKKIICHPSSLVKYRTHPHAISNATRVMASVDGIKEQELKAAQYANMFIEFNRLVKKLASLHYSKDNKQINHNNIDSSTHFFETQRNWHAMSCLNRLTRFIKSKSIKEVRFMAPRLIGLPWFAFVKYQYSKYFRSGFL